MQIDLNLLNEVAVEAGKAILEIYDTGDFGVEMKLDNSPLTKADKAAHNVIVEYLDKYFGDIPILSEEGKNIPYEERKNWDKFWCVDPLDGTKEFIKRNGEFTVNIALIENNYPVLGVIHIPVRGISYLGDEDRGAFIISKERELKAIMTSTKYDEGIVAVKSRSHASDDDEEFFSRFNIADSISIGSSLKFCLVAEGSAHIYKRSGPTMEWDTAAGQAIVEAAGGVVLRDGKRFWYNKEELLNPGFICACNEKLVS